MSEPRKFSRLRRWIFGSVWASVALGALLSLALIWLLATTSGARFALEHSLALVGGRVGAIEGRLVGPLAIASIDMATPQLSVRASRVTLDWSPARLFGREVRIKNLHAESLEIASAKSDGPARPPATLVLPFRLFIEQAGVDRLRVGSLEDAQAGVELGEVSLKLAANQAAWILGGLEATTPAGRAGVSGTVGARAPFNLDLKGELAGTRNSTAYRVAVTAKGPLAQIEAAFDGREGGITGTGSAQVEPFAASPLRRLVASLDGVDLASLVEGPHTKLRIEADLAPAGEAFLAGSVKVANAEPGPVDKSRLPVVAASAQLALAPDRVEATSLAIAFTGGGRAQGHATWSGGQLDARLAVTDADLLDWHSSLKATKLSGDITAIATGKAQAFKVALADPRFEIAGDVRIADEVLTLEKVRLARGSAFAQASATLALGGARTFAAEGRIQGLDPAEFAKLPAGEINAVFTAKGNLAKGPAGELALDITRSRFAGLAADGQIKLAVEGERLTRTQASITLGATRLVANGALGKAGDALQVKLVSPDLSPLGRAFGLALGGKIDLDARVSGTFAALSGRGALDARNLLLPGDVRLASLKGQIDLGSGDAGVANGMVEVRGLSQGSDKTALVETATATLKGTRRAQEIRLETRFAEGSSVRALLDGGLVAGRQAPEWRGRLESLDLAGRAAFALTAPTTLFVSADRIELGEARFSGEPGEVRLALTRWTPKGLAFRGSSRAVVVRTIQRILNVQGPVGSNLIMAGDWDVRVGETVEGFVSFRRDRGDVRLGEPRQALGLDALVLRVDAKDGQVKGMVEVSGKQVGRWKGEAAATIRRGSGGLEIAPSAPLEGRFTVDVPDLSWTAAWIGPEARAGGHLSGEGSLAGTMGQPTWQGRVKTTGIVVREPTLGLDVADGTIVIGLKDRNATIEQFALSMPWQPSADAARAIAAAKRPESGTLTAEGAVDLGSRKGTIRLKAAAWPLTRLTTRFLAASGEVQIEVDGNTTAVSGNVVTDAGWFGIPASAPPALSDDVVVIRDVEAPVAARSEERFRLDLNVDLGEHLHFRGRGLSTRLAGSLRLLGEVGANLRTTGTIRAVGGTYDAYGKKLAIERGALNFQGAVDNPGLNVLALRKGLPVEAGVEVLGTVARPKVRLYSSPDVPEPEKLAWLVLGRGQGDVSAGDAGTLISAANSLLGSDSMPNAKLLGGLGLDDVKVGSDESSTLGTLPQSTVAGRTGTASSAQVVTVGKQLTDDIYVSYRQGLADAEGSLRMAWQLSKRLQVILRAGYLPGLDAVFRFSFR